MNNEKNRYRIVNRNNENDLCTTSQTKYHHQRNMNSSEEKKPPHFNERRGEKPK